MATEFLHEDIWPELTEVVSVSRRPCAAAVAYFGAGASGLLPLPGGSRLVVDASEGKITSGDTCPADLIKLQKKGVLIYSVSNLHAKVFVIGRTAYVGSNNASNRSAEKLIEATIRTTDPEAVQAAKEFVQQNCFHELTPEVLQQLKKIYRPPRVPGGKKGKKKARASAALMLPRVHLAQLHRMVEYPPEAEKVLYATGLKLAKRDRKHPRSYEMEDFRESGECSIRRGDVVVQITDEGKGKVLVSPPGNVLRVKAFRTSRGRAAYVYLELPVLKRRQRNVVGGALGRGAAKRLAKDGLIRNAQFARVHAPADRDRQDRCIVITKINRS